MSRISRPARRVTSSSLLHSSTILLALLFDLATFHRLSKFSVKMPRGCRTRRPTAPVQRLTRNRVVKTAVKAAQRRPVNISSIDELIELERQKKLDDAEKRQKILDASEPQMRALEYLFRVTEIDPEYRGDEWKDIGKLEPRDDGVIEGLPLEEGGISYKRLTKHHFNLALDFILRQDLQLGQSSSCVDKYASLGAPN